MKENYSLESVLSAFESLQQEKWINKTLNKVKEKIFWNNLNKENIEEFKSFVRKFTSLYYLMKDKFSEIWRSTGERYFEHLREVVNNVLDLPNPNIDKVLIAIAHDSIEDTNKTYEWLSEDYWYKIALSVEAISKQSWENYLENNDNVTIEMKQGAKNKRNDEYFSHLESFEKMSQHVNSIALSKWIELTEEELSEITQNTIDVKFADRIHNLSTQWNPDDTDTVKRKIFETKKYFLNIAKEVNIVAYTKLQSLILELEIRLNNTLWQTKNIIEW